MAKVDKIEIAHSLLNTVRRSIVSALLPEPRYISDLVKKLEIDRSTICYHLNILEQAGLLKSEYKILEAAHSKGRAGRLYSIDLDRYLEAIGAIDDLKTELSAELPTKK